MFGVQQLRLGRCLSLVCILNNPALIVIDMQQGLLQREVYNKQNLISNINKLLAFFSKKEMQIYFARHTNESFSKENSDAWQIANELTMYGKEIFINKTHSSVYKEKQFVSSLKLSNINSIVVVGLVSNGCVQATCNDAKKNGFSVVLISDGHSTFHLGGQKVVDHWNECLQIQGIQVVSTNEFLSLNNN